MKQRITWVVAVVSSIVLTAIGITITGCSAATPRTPASASALEKTPAQQAKTLKVGGAQLWAQNCGHCHNIRSPNSYSDAQWDVVMLHMRVRANLTAEEHKENLAFLKSAH